MGSMMIAISSLIIGIIISGVRSNEGTYSCWRTQTDLKRFYFAFYVNETKSAFPVYCDCTFNSKKPECTAVQKQEYFKYKPRIRPLEIKGAKACCSTVPPKVENTQLTKVRGLPTLAMKKNRVCFVDNNDFHFSVDDGSNRHICKCDEDETADKCMKRKETNHPCDQTCKKKFNEEYTFQKNHCCGSKQYYFDCYGVANTTLFKVFMKELEVYKPQLYSLCRCPAVGSKKRFSMKRNCDVSVSVKEEKRFRLSYKYDNYNCCEKRLIKS